MGEALIIGLIGSSALVLGGVAGAWWAAPERVTGVLLAFASGTLVAALAFELSQKRSRRAAWHRLR